MSIYYTEENVYIIQDLMKNGRSILLSPIELKVLHDNLTAINDEITKLQMLYQVTLDSPFKVPLSRTKSLQVIKVKNKVVIEFSRSSTLSIDKKHQFCIRFSASQWKKKSSFLIMWEKVSNKRPAPECETTIPCKKNCIEKDGRLQCTLTNNHQPQDKDCNLKSREKPAPQTSECEPDIPFAKICIEKDSELQCTLTEHSQLQRSNDKDRNQIKIKISNKTKSNNPSEPNTCNKLLVYQWKWIDSTSQDVLERGLRWWIDPVRCAANALLNKPDQLVTFGVEVNNVDNKELIRNIYLFLVEKELNLLKQRNCVGCNFGKKDLNGYDVLAPSQKDHLHGCLEDLLISLDIYLDTACDIVQGQEILEIFLKLKKEYCCINQVNVNDFIYIMNYKPTLDYVRSKLLSFDVPYLFASFQELPV